MRKDGKNGRKLEIEIKKKRKLSGC